MGILLHWVVSALALLLTAYLVRGFKVKSFGAAMIAAVVIVTFPPVLEPV